MSREQDPELETGEEGLVEGYFKRIPGDPTKLKFWRPVPCLIGSEPKRDEGSEMSKKRKLTPVLGLRYTLLDIDEVARVTSLSKPTIWRMVKNGGFPKPKRISARRVAWESDRIQAHLDSLEEASR